MAVVQVVLEPPEIVARFRNKIFRHVVLVQGELLIPRRRIGDGQDGFPGIVGINRFDNGVGPIALGDGLALVIGGIGLVAIRTKLFPLS